ncbi:LAFA_0D08724g1_1 [Lachancea sp. 'fantastica']|nr:LAFA_0D08724g1_1 [Lachancea sp. 'fantastica']
MNGARILGKVGPIDKRRTHEFQTIKNSEFYDSIKHLPELTPSKQLTQEATFREVQAELNQVKADVVRIDTLVESDISLERAQTSKIEVQLKSSLRRLNHYYKKVERAREKRGRVADTEQQDCLLRISELETTRLQLRDQVELVIQKIEKKENELPQKNRLLNELSFNKRHYPLLHELLARNFTPAPSSDDHASQKTDGTAGFEIENVNHNSLTRAAPIPSHSPPGQVAQPDNQTRKEQGRSSLGKASAPAIPPPSIISDLLHSKSSTASVSTTFHQVTGLETTTKSTSGNDTSSSLYDNLSVKR